MDGLISHFVLDDGRLVVAHAGLKEAYHGRSSGRVRSFALYGDTTGETDEYGLPVRYPWARDYRGQATVVYGHTPVPEAEWVNNTICLDTGVVFGGKITALRYPERELVSVPAEQEWYVPVRPLVAATPEREPTALAIDDVAGERWLESPYAGKVKIPAENAAAALEVMSRFAVDPRWLVHLPPTMSPATSTQREGLLEHPDQAFDDYAAMGVTAVVCEEKHMGSRAIAVLARDEAAAERRFGVADGGTGTVYTRTGRPFFDDTDVMTDLVGRLRAAAAPLFERLETDWLVLDCELLPWSAKALGLIRGQYAAVGAAARHALPALGAALDAAAARGLDVADLSARAERKLDHARAFRDAYAAYCRPTDGLDGVTLAPFQVLAAEGRVAAVTETHAWHLEQLALMRGRGDHPDPAPVRRPRVRRAACRGRRLVGGAHRRRRRGHGREAGAPARRPGRRTRAARAQGARTRVPPDHLRPRLHRLPRRAPPAPPRQEARSGPARARPRPRRAHGVRGGRPAVAGPPAGLRDPGAGVGAGGPAALSPPRVRFASSDAKVLSNREMDSTFTSLDGSWDWRRAQS